MKMTGSLSIFMFALVMGVAGCASSDKGTVIILQEPEKLKQLHVNKSTKAQVRELLGEPQSITMYSNETENWVYQSTHTDYTETYLAKKALSFLFSKKGILKQTKRETKHK